MLRGAIIGFGRMGITHFSILNSHPDVKIVAICDTHSLVRNNAAKYLKVESYDNYEKMLDKMDLQFAVVATPTAMHKETVESALKRGLHVFVEKPFTLNPQQGNELVQLAKEAKVVNQIGYVFRFNDVFQEVKKLIDMGALGDLLTFKMEMNGPTVLHDVKSSWRFKKGEGGGCLYDFASHAIDLINYFIGPPDKVVGSVLQSIYSEHLEDFVITTYIYENGIRGSLLANWSDPSYRKVTTHFEILGKKGKVIADMHSYKVFFRDKPDRGGFVQGWNERYITDFVQPVRFYLRGFEFTRQLDYFVDCMMGRANEGLASFADGFLTDSVIERIRVGGQK